MAKNIQVQLASRPTGAVEESNFRIVESDVPKPGGGAILVKNLWLSLDPYMRGRMSAAKSYAKYVEIGEVMVGGTVGQVVESNNPRFKVGDHVVGALGWQLYAVSYGEGLTVVDPKLVPVSAACRVLRRGSACWNIAHPRPAKRFWYPLRVARSAAWSDSSRNCRAAALWALPAAQRNANTP